MPRTGPSIFLVRHGETEWSATGKHTSRTDVELTEDGVRAARALGERLAGRDFALVLTSPMHRARKRASSRASPIGRRSTTTWSSSSTASTRA